MQLKCCIYLARTVTLWRFFFPALNPISVHSNKMNRPKWTLVCTGTLIILIQLTKHQEILQMHLQNQMKQLCNSYKEDHGKAEEERNFLRVWHCYY